MRVGLSAYSEAVMRRVSSWALVGLLAVSGCAVGGEDQDTGRKPSETPTRSIDSQGIKACNEFARWLAADEDPSTRQDIGQKVYALASTSKSGELADKSALLNRETVQGSNENWALAADSFAYECQQLGWTADDAK